MPVTRCGHPLHRLGIRMYCATGDRSSSRTRPLVDRASRPLAGTGSLDPRPRVAAYRQARKPLPRTKRGTRS